MSSLFESTYNPDVLSCIANLSNDEVFTPPEIANQVLDMLPDELWHDPNARFLDPASKSGIFLREIAKRLIDGLEDEYPDLQERLDHIYKNQLFGIAITELTSLLSRRSLYCSKYPNSVYSVVRFETADGNVRFKHVEHEWYAGRCVKCGATQKEYDRDNELEQYAYEFIHLDDPSEAFPMKFDVIVGNPPYQLSDGGGVGSSAIPLYQSFVQQAKKLNPRYLAMITPSRWFTGGRGLDAYRDEMLHDDRIREIHDFIDASDCFPGVEIKGGVSYFLWTRDSHGDCTVYSHSGNTITSQSTRPLLEDGMETFIRNNNQISILRKVQAHDEKSFAEIVSANDPFGFDVRVKGSYKRVKPDFSLKRTSGTIPFYYNGWRRQGIGWIKPEKVGKGHDLIHACKVLIPKAWGTGNPTTDWLKPFLAEQDAVCTETYLLVGPFSNDDEARNAITYTQTKFFHYMVSLIKITQNTMQKAYTMVPLQDFSRPWTDDDLYAKYELTDEEIAAIESLIGHDGTEGENDA